MSDFRKYLDLVNELSQETEYMELGDSFDIELNESFVIETGVIGFTEDGVIIQGDDNMMDLLEVNDILSESVELDEKMVLGWGQLAETGMVFGMGQAYNESEIHEGSMKHRMTSDAEKMSLEQFLEYWATRPEDVEWCTNFYNQVNGIEDDKEIDEAKYQGRTVPLGKPMKGDVKKSKVYVRKPNGKVVKVNFGDKKMKIKKSNPKRRKSFRARHHCENPGPRWKARYWSCRAW
jgi:hypothetical protein